MNKTQLTIAGNLTKDPFFTNKEGSKPFCAFTVACNRDVFNKEENKYINLDTTYFEVKAWGRLAENLNSSIKKGQPVVVTGPLHVETYENKDGAVYSNSILHADYVGLDLGKGIAVYEKNSFSQKVENTQPDPATDTSAPFESQIQPTPTEGQSSDGTDNPNFLQKTE
ncbi:MAG: single-stranded DNA-binding protein [Bifidobacteriaceae bacterium]|jgi:single-strand DNA-binding protein|nr:single-stranded DNA-binding protein [Bifidobacteriaceae bacterium]